jgi:hypothetical protein
MNTRQPEELESMVEGNAGRSGSYDQACDESGRPLHGRSAERGPEGLAAFGSEVASSGRERESTNPPF